MADVKEVRELLFRVIRNGDGREFAIYTNGEIEGFGDDCIVFNQHHAIVNQRVALALRGVGHDPSHLARLEEMLRRSNNIRQPYRCPDCGGYAVGGGCTCSLETKHKRWDEATKDDPERGTGNRIL
jgi:hypothetical protein